LSPTAAKPASVAFSRSRSASVRAPGRGISPMFLAVNDSDRLTRLPHAATSSSLLRRTHSDPVKSVSLVSGPAAYR
jgi:hypothetical protein